MKLYFTRHGQGENNVRRVFSNDHSLLHLTEKGKEQAHELAERIKHIPFEKFYCSPVLRVEETASIIADTIHKEPEVVPQIREYSAGVYEETSEQENGAWRHIINVDTEERWWKYKDFEAKMEGGESFNDIKKRFMPFVDTLVETYKNTDKNILILAHCGIYKAMMPEVFPNISLDFSFKHEIKNCGLIIGEYLGEHMVCVEWDGMKI
jgi:broad specificity phosphatase PhoE